MKNNNGKTKAVFHSQPRLGFGLENNHLGVPTHNYKFIVRLNKSGL